jgi:mannose-6-phosphate isomerase-like protein (cupin superfamily)
MNCHSSCSQNRIPADHGPNPSTVNLARLATQNTYFRAAIWTGCHLQLTVMSIPPRGEIGLEMHPETDQLIRVEQGTAVVEMGPSNLRQDWQQTLCTGDAVFIPAGTWHNLLNVGNGDLKVSSVYAPPNHPKGTIHRTKAEAEQMGD